METLQRGSNEVATSPTDKHSPTTPIQNQDRVLKEHWLADNETTPVSLPLVQQTQILAENVLPNQTSDPTSSKSTVSQSLAGLGTSLSSRLYQLLPKYSPTMSTSHLKRRLNPSSFSWLKSKRAKVEHYEKTRERGDLSPSLQEIASREPSQPTISNQPTQTLVREKNQQILARKMISPESVGNYNHQTCRGTSNEESTSECKTPVVPSRPLSSVGSTMTSNPLSCTLNSPQKPLEAFPCPNGITSSREKQLTSTESCRRSIVLQLIRRERLALEKQKSALAALRRKGKLKQALNGPLLGGLLRERLPLSLNTGNRNSSSMETISSGYSQRRDLLPMDKSFYTTEESGMRSAEDKLSCLPTTIISPHYMQLPCKMTESNIIEAGNQGREVDQKDQRQKFAEGSTAKKDADFPTQDAGIAMPACPVERTDMENLRVGSEELEFKLGLKPKYLRHNLWSPDAESKLVAADWTETAEPLPRPPLSEYESVPVCQTLEKRPDLFRVVSSVRVEVLAKMLKNHPNQEFVSSVLEGLRDGFWPWATTTKEGYPLTHDESKSISLTIEKESFLKSQLAHEQNLERISGEVGEDLLPGMYCMPNYVVPKPHSSGWRLVNDQSAGPYSLNSMVDRRFVTGYPLDNLAHFGELLLKKRQCSEHETFVAWKSDISEAYRMCPMHELWQLKQGVRILGKLYVDRVNVFGGSASPAIFIAVNALVAWVAKHERSIDDLIYVDDSFGVEVKDQTSWYAPYEQNLPSQQARLLELWDELGIPHKREKQIHGERITILGIEVNVNEMTFMLTQEAREQLKRELEEWCQRGVRRRVKEWQRVAGWLNWALNVYPLLRPSLNNVYAKLRGKEQDMKVWANSAIREDFEWAKQKVAESDGILLLKSLTWEINDSTCVLETDACPEGYAFWYPSTKQGYTVATPRGTPSTKIIFFEALAVLSALNNAHHRLPQESKIVIYSDNSTTVAMFNSLRALPEYNCILKAAVDILLEGKHQLRVLHIAGERNGVADALSRGEFMRAIDLQPSLTIRTFAPYILVERRQSPPILKPPRQTLGQTFC
jgi:hypothetical protein